MSELGNILNKATADYKTFEAKSRDAADALTTVKMTLSEAVGVAERLDNDLAANRASLHKLKAEVDLARKDVLDAKHELEKHLTALAAIKAEIAAEEARLVQVKKLVEDYKASMAKL